MPEAILANGTHTIKEGISQQNIDQDMGDEIQLFLII